MVNTLKHEELKGGYTMGNKIIIDACEVFENEFEVMVAGSTININSSVSGELNIFDLTGKVIISQQITEGQSSISLENVAAGVYVVKGPRGNAQKIAIK